MFAKGVTGEKKYTCTLNGTTAYWNETAVIRIRMYSEPVDSFDGGAY